MSRTEGIEARELRVVPDLGDELTHVLGQVEELLLTFAVWESEDGVELPIPFARGRALAALRDIRDAVRPTQSLDGREPVPGRLLAPDGRYEHLPLRFVRIPGAQLDLLEHAAQLLADLHAHDDLDEALVAHAEAYATTAAELIGGLSRAVSMLTLAWDDDVRTLRDAVTAHPSTTDVVLSPAEEAAYQRVADRLNRLWSYGSGVDRFRY